MDVLVGRRLEPFTERALCNRVLEDAHERHVGGAFRVPQRRRRHWSGSVRISLRLAYEYMDSSQRYCSRDCRQPSQANHEQGTHWCVSRPLHARACGVGSMSWSGESLAPEMRENVPFGMVLFRIILRAPARDDVDSNMASAHGACPHGVVRLCAASVRHSMPSTHRARHGR